MIAASSRYSHVAGPSYASPSKKCFNSEISPLKNSGVHPFLPGLRIVHCNLERLSRILGGQEVNKKRMQNRNTFKGESGSSERERETETEREREKES